MTRSNDTLPDPRHLPPPVEPPLSPVRFNAVKHGILSVSPVIPVFENQADWEEFRNSIFQEIAPEGGLQLALADRVATLLWRLMRIVRYEREVVTDSIMNIGRDIHIADSYLGEPPKVLTLQLKERMERAAMSRLLPEDHALHKILRYEVRLHR